MPGFKRKYSDQQREALIEARIERELTGNAIAELAAKGALTLDGKALEPFTITPNTVYTLTREHRRRRAKKGGDEPYLDRLARLQDRCLSAAEYELRGYERKQRKGQGNPETLRQIVRVLREAKAMGDPKDTRRARPGGYDPEAGAASDGASRGGMAASILSAARRGAQEPEAETEQELPPISEERGAETTHEADTQSSADTEEPANVQDQDQPIPTLPGPLRGASLTHTPTHYMGKSEADMA